MPIERQETGTCDVAAGRRPSLSFVFYKEKRDKQSASNWIPLFYAVNEIVVLTVSIFNRKLHKYLNTPGLHNGIYARSKNDSSPKTVLFEDSKKP